MALGYLSLWIQFLSLLPSLPPSLPLSLPPNLIADLNNSSSTLTSSEGDSDSKNGDTLNSLDNPLPNGMDRTEPDKEEGGKDCVAVAGSRGKQNATLNKEITTINLRLVLPGVSEPIEVMVCPPVGSSPLLC